MGEIGIERNTFLFKLRYWEILSIIRGYRRRAHTTWEAARWQTFFVLKAMGCKNIGKNSTDFCPFPWEKGDSSIPTDEEIEEARRLLHEELKRKNAKD